MRRCGSAVVTFTITPLLPLYKISIFHNNNNNNSTHKKPYRSSTTFKLQPHEVNESNIPTAKEIAEMIPTHAELQQQLPSARELEAQYVQSNKSINNNNNNNKQNINNIISEPPLWPNSDTVEDIMNEERFGSSEENETLPPPTPQHILLAWRALLWGSLYAFIGVTIVVIIAMYMCEMKSFTDIFTYLRGYEERERLRLEEISGQDINYYVLDLTNPSVIIQQAQDIWKALEELANEEEKEKKEKRVS